MALAARHVVQWVKDRGLGEKKVVASALAVEETVDVGITMTGVGLVRGTTGRMTMTIVMAMGITKGVGMIMASGSAKE